MSDGQVAVLVVGGDIDGSQFLVNLSDLASCAFIELKIGEQTRVFTIVPVYAGDSVLYVLRPSGITERDVLGLLFERYQGTPPETR